MICFSFLSMTIVNAQFGIRNNTDCEYTATVSYADGCDYVNELLPITVFPNTTTPVTIPSSYSTYIVKIGHNSSLFTGCTFEISLCPGLNLNASEPIKCGECEGAVATLFPNGSVIIQ